MDNGRSQQLSPATGVAPSELPALQIMFAYLGPNPMISLSVVLNFEPHNSRLVGLPDILLPVPHMENYNFRGLGDRIAIEASSSHPDGMIRFIIATKCG